MAIGGISSTLNGASGGAGAGPKVQEANFGLFEKVLQQMQKVVGSEPSAAGTNSSKAVEEMRDQTTQFKLDFQRKLMQKLLEKGVDLSQPFSLKGDGFGGVEVAGGHPDAETIEALFEEDSELRGEFSQLSSQAGRLYAADRTAFTTGDAPANGSSDAFFDGSQPAFNLIVRDGATEMAFLR